MAILRGFLGSKGRFVGVLGVPPQKEMPIIQMGLAGRAKAEHEFQIPRMVEETLAVYRAAGWRET